MTGAGLVARHTSDVVSAQSVRWLLESITGEPFSELASRELSSDVARRLEARIVRVEMGEPLQYVIGTWQFRTLDLLVDPRALIPRPETEQVVEAALVALRRPGRPAPNIIADLGCGSGAIALSLAIELSPQHRSLVVYATDASASTLSLAQENASRVGADHVVFLEGSWFDALPTSARGLVDLVISNPPYVGRAEASSLDPSLDFEPASALFSDDGEFGQGTGDLIAIIDHAANWLSPTGVLVLECDPRQVDGLRDRASGLGSVTEIVDLAGRRRGIVVDVMGAKQ